MKKNIIFYLILFANINCSLKKIYIIPPCGYENEKLFDMNDHEYNRDNCVKHFYDLRDALRLCGYNLITARPNDKMEDGEFIISSGIYPHINEKIKKYNSKKLVAMIWEPPTVEISSYKKENHIIFNKIFIMDDSFVDEKKYIKLFYPHPNIKMIEQCPSFKEKKFCTLISSNKSTTSNYPYELYTERKRAIEFFNDKEGFIFYGKGWPINLYKSFGGKVLRKLDILKNFKFCICYENTSNINGYITEKIFDCFEAGCVPVYYGAPNVTKYVPENCFIDFRKFKNYQDLYNFLLNINESQYQEYINNIQKFLLTPEAQKFSFNYFNEIVIKNLLIQK